MNAPTNFNTLQAQGQGLLGAGWRPLNRQLDWVFLAGLAVQDSAELLQKTIDLASSVADAAGRSNYTWWANLLNVFSDDTRYYVDEFWSYITPDIPGPSHHHADLLSSETPLRQPFSRDNIALQMVFDRLQELTVLKILKILDRPDFITQPYLERNFYFPVERFTTWERLEVINCAYAYWQSHDLWLLVTAVDKARRLTLMSRDLAPLISKATYGLAVMLSGYQSRVGQLQAPFPVRSFPPDIQNFTHAVQEAVLSQAQLAVLVSGPPGTGKTAWTQAVAKEILIQLGYVVFILDHEAVENFVPPTYLERICLIINEADNLAQDRSTTIAQTNGRTERILSLLDGTLYQSVVDETGIQSQQKLVVLMTCNTVDRLDPALLRKGRVDLMYEFTHAFVSARV